MRFSQEVFRVKGKPIVDKMIDDVIVCYSLN